MKIAVQLYTLRDLLQNDTWGTLERLCDMGFKAGELAGTYGHPVEQFAEKCQSLGFKIICPHNGIEMFEDKVDELVTLCKAFGTDCAVLPYVGRDVYGDGWAKAGARFEKIGARLKEHGLKFLYHNHAFEFELENGKPGFDVLWESCDPTLVGVEMDAFWVQYGGGDPVAYLEKLGSRVRTMHFKDMKPGEKKEMEDVGYGILDWKNIIPAAKRAGVEYAIIEHDNPTGDPLQHVARSRDFLISQGLKD